MDLTKEESSSIGLPIMIAALCIVGLGLALGFFMRDGGPGLTENVANTAKTANPIAKADNGYVQCFVPNVASKTCMAMSGYTKSGEGTWTNTTLILLDANSPLTVEISGEVFLKNGDVCGRFKPEDLQDYKIRYAGRNVPNQLRAQITRALDRQYSVVLNKTSCSVFFEDNGAKMMKTTVDGKDVDAPHVWYRWVLKSDGYRVAPRSLQR
jgi:hypothetical protein